MAKERQYDPLKERAKFVADALWERAQKVADVLAPEVPYDQEEWPPFYQWMLLERVAMQLSPEAWDDPNAIRDLMALRKQFAPALPVDPLAVAAEYRERERRGLPDPSISPQSPEWDAQLRRLTRGA